MFSCIQIKLQNISITLKKKFMTTDNKVLRQQKQNDYHKVVQIYTKTSHKVVIQQTHLFWASIVNIIRSSTNFRQQSRIQSYPQLCTPLTFSYNVQCIVVQFGTSKKIKTGEQLFCLTDFEGFCFHCSGVSSSYHFNATYIWKPSQC